MFEAGRTPALHFGGPDRPPRHLRDLLRARVDAVPAGGEILWATYYFRDRDLADALVAAHDRGVRVMLHVEGQPRRKAANRPVIAILGEALGPDLHVNARFASKPKYHPYLHSKIYWFSHPVPTVLIGSFNPSGDMPEDLAVIADIGDQDRGHNLLAEYTDPVIAAALRTHIAGLGRFALRLRPDQNRPVKSGLTTIRYYPRLRPGTIERRLARLVSGSRVQGAISHLKKGFLLDALIRAARAGAQIDLLVHDTERRVPVDAVRALTEAGVTIRRYVHPEGLPLHAKFLLIESGGEKTAYFGSFNYNHRSRRLNREILVESRDPLTYVALAGRLTEIAAEQRDA